MSRPPRWLAALRKLDPCSDGLAFAEGHTTLQAAWDACERPDWMLWLAHHAGVDRKLMVEMACDCAAITLPIWRKRYPNDDRPAEAIRVARAWAQGKASIEDVRKARSAAYAAAAAWADAYAASAASAAYAAADAASAAARGRARRRMANLIRKRLPQAPALKEMAHA